VSLDPNLLKLSNRGLIPGPNESEQVFLLRADSSPSACHLPYPDALQRVSEIFFMAPDWVEVFVQSKGLYPWEGAAAWIEQREDGVRCTRIQIKDSFLSRLYPKEEVIAHEMVHAMRVMFDEKRFEEILAYRTSQNSFRRYCGPFFAGSKETIAFLISFVVPWLAWMGELTFEIELLASNLFFMPAVVLAWGIFRLARSQDVFSSALKNLKKTIADRNKALAALLGLTDSEIELFAKSSAEEIRSYASAQKDKSVRWRQLYSTYFV
jgi:hypothetical protein